VLSADNVHCEKKRRFLVTFCRPTKSYPLAAGQRKLFNTQMKKAGFQLSLE
jgi:hypothetical protein